MPKLHRKIQFLRELPEFAAALAAAAGVTLVVGGAYRLHSTGALGPFAAIVVVVAGTTLVAHSVGSVFVACQRLVRRVWPAERSLARSLARLEQQGMVVADLYLAMIVVHKPLNMPSFNGAVERTRRLRDRGGVRSGQLDRRVLNRVLNWAWFAAEYPQQAATLADALVESMPLRGLSDAGRCVKSLGLSSLPVSELPQDTAGLRFVQEVLGRTSGTSRGPAFEESWRLARRALALGPAWRKPLLAVLRSQEHATPGEMSARVPEVIALLSTLPESHAETVHALHGRWQGDLAELVATARAL